MNFETPMENAYVVVGILATFAVFSFWLIIVVNGFLSTTSRMPQPRTSKSVSTGTYMDVLGSILVGVTLRNCSLDLLSICEAPPF